MGVCHASVFPGNGTQESLDFLPSNFFHIMCGIFLHQYAFCFLCLLNLIRMFSFDIHIPPDIPNRPTPCLRVERRGRSRTGYPRRRQRARSSLSTSPLHPQIRRRCDHPPQPTKRSGEARRGDSPRHRRPLRRRHPRHRRRRPPSSGSSSTRPRTGPASPTGCRRPIP